jgi:hypothetical protein
MPNVRVDRFNELQRTPYTRRIGESTIHQRALSHVQYTTTLSILNCTNAGDARGRVLHVAQRFERFLDTYRRPDGRRWSGQAIDEATDGIVTRSYITNLRKGRIENPGYEKMRAIAKAMGFPPEMWFEEDLIVCCVPRAPGPDSAAVSAPRLQPSPPPHPDTSA